MPPVLTWAIKIMKDQVGQRRSAQRTYLCCLGYIGISAEYRGSELVVSPTPLMPQL